MAGLVVKGRKEMTKEIMEGTRRSPILPWADRQLQRFYMFQLLLLAAPNGDRVVIVSLL